MTRLRIRIPRRRNRQVPPPLSGPERAAQLVRRRAAIVALINGNCDRVLCVSDRVGEVIMQHGIDGAIMQTSYIGSLEAEKFTETVPRPSLLRADGTLGLGYLGYMRRDKGFFFLLDALETLPDDLVGRLHLLVAARTGPPGAMARLETLRHRLAGLRHVDGYSHDGLDELLSEVDLGLIPSLWEDNLPQVAIEMHARHIPLLTSDLGGARELANCPDMVFVAGSIDSLGDRLGYVLNGGPDIGAYWRGARAPVTMRAHLDDMLRLYEGEITPSSAEIEGWISAGQPPPSPPLPPPLPQPQPLPRPAHARASQVNFNLSPTKLASVQGTETAGSKITSRPSAMIAR